MGLVLMKKAVGVILALVVAILSWVVLILVLVIIAGFFWQETMPSWYAFILLIPPIGVSTVFGYMFYGKYKRKHKLDNNHLTPEGEANLRYITHDNRDDRDNLIETINELKHIIADQSASRQKDLNEIIRENEELKVKLANISAENEKLEKANEMSVQDVQKQRQNAVKEELLTIDLMDGHDFEFWCADALKNSGFLNVAVTPGSNDKGVDIVAEKGGLRYAFQCKRYNSDLGNSPVQEVFTGQRIYNCHVGVVITNRDFTVGAKDAALATGVLLWGRSWIIEYLFSKHGVLGPIEIN